MKNNIGGFINCLCTYLSIIYKYHLDSNDYLNFLSDKKIIEKNYTIKGLEKNNPWQYQPFMIGNNIKESKSMTIQYIEFLMKNNNIYTTKIKKNRDLLKNIGFFYYMVPVDEFYIPNSKFYMRLHNRHFLLIYSLENTIINYIDSENNEKQKIDIKILLNAMESEYADTLMYRIDYSNCKKHVASKMPYIFYFPYLSLDFSKKNEDKTNLFFEMESLRLSITFQLIPYILMCIKNADLHIKDLYTNLYNNLEKLNQLLLFSIIKKELYMDRLIFNITQINKLLDDISTVMNR